MVVVCDSKKRVTLPGAKPGETFEVQFPDSERVLLVRLHTVPSKPEPVQLEKRDGFTVAVSPQPINPVALAEALAEFP
jgi:hypothetical protein